VAVGLFALLVIISTAAFEAEPAHPPPPSDQMLEDREDILYFIDAEILANRLYPDPSARWLHDIGDYGSDCVSIGNGVWYAKGYVTLEREHQVYGARWEVYFLPDGPTPLFTRVGSLKSGDMDAAFRIASDPDVPDGGATK